MLEQHLELIQPENYARPNARTTTSIPVFLIHDGGGTTFAYHCLEPMKRLVYGIQNPHFRTGGVFEGGLPEMARLYASWIRSTVAQHDFPAPRNPDGSVDILIGGWSLGGLLSTEIYQELQDDSSIRIVGILMIDSIYPFNTGKPLVFAPSDPIHTLGSTESAAELSSGRLKNQMLSRQAMADARKMVRAWSIPTGFQESHPRIILLRATNYVPVDGTGISVLDACREERTLGWDQYDESLFEDVLDVQGHHFDLFHAHRIIETSTVVKRALDRLAGYAGRS